MSDSKTLDGFPKPNGLDRAAVNKPTPRNPPAPAPKPGNSVPPSTLCAMD